VLTAAKETGDYLAGVFMPMLSTIKDAFTTAWAGISTAIQAGDWQAAGEIAMAGLEVAVAAGLLAMRTMWEDYRTAVLETILGSAEIAIQTLKQLSKLGGPFAGLLGGKLADQELDLRLMPPRHAGNLPRGLAPPGLRQQGRLHHGVEGPGRPGGIREAPVARLRRDHRRRRRIARGAGQPQRIARRRHLQPQRQCHLLAWRAGQVEGPIRERREKGHGREPLRRAGLRGADGAVERGEARQRRVVFQRSTSK
jgi:hypothetical protein